MTRVAVTMVLYRSDPTAVERALAALAASSPAPAALFVHINSDDGSTVPAIPATLGGTVTRSTVNLGFAGGHNRLLADAFADGADLVVVHNPDVELEPAALSTLTAAAKEHAGCLLGPLLELADPDTGAATGLIDTVGIRWTRDARHLDDRQGAPLPGGDTGPRPVAGISGACLAVPRPAYERIVAAGGEFFDGDFIAYREDAELALRAGLLGVESWLVPAARGRHVRGLRGTTRGHDAFVDMLGVRNRFLIAAKWGRRRPGSLPAILVRDLAVIAAVLLTERTSIRGLQEAWLLRRVMRAKRERVLAWSRANPRSSP